MSRLTNSDLMSASYSPWELCGLDKDCLRSCEECNIVEMYKKLAAYEDIGLKPEELQEIVDKQKWHVVADGDLPPKPEIGMKKYLITKVREQDFRKKMVTELYWDGNGFYHGLFSSEIRDILAWRELPEPREGAVK